MVATKSLKILAALAVLLAPSAFSAKREAAQQIQVSVELIERPADGELQIWVRVQNLSQEATFLAVRDTREPLILHFVLVEQQQSDKTWKAVGPWRSVPPPAVFELKPGGSARGVIFLSEFLPMSRGGGRIHIEGKHRIKLWYFNSRDEWDNYWADLMKGRKPRGKRPMAISEPFDIPPRGSRK